MSAYPVVAVIDLPADLLTIRTVSAPASIGGTVGSGGTAGLSGGGRVRGVRGSGRVGGTQGGSQ